MRLLPGALIAILVLTMGAGCRQADDVGRLVRDTAVRFRNSADDADDLLTRVRTQARSASVDELRAAQIANSVQLSPGTDEVLSRALASTRRGAPSLVEDQAYDFALGASCDVLDKLVAGESIEAEAIVADQLASSIPPLELAYLAGTVSSIANDLDAGHSDVAARRITLMIRCYQARR